VKGELVPIGNLW